MRKYECNYCGWSCGYYGDGPETVATNVYIGCEDEELAVDEVPYVETCPECKELVNYVGR